MQALIVYFFCVFCPFWPKKSKMSNDESCKEKDKTSTPNKSFQTLKDAATGTETTDKENSPLNTENIPNSRSS